jgi:amino-acid N-acetyltransferase
MMRLRRAKRTDAATIRRLVYSERLNPLGLDWRRFWLALDECSTIIACGQIKPHQGGARELASIVVAPGWRGRGVARAIIEQLLAHNSPPLYLTCRAALEPFYARFGFVTLRDPQVMPPYFRCVSCAAGGLKRLFPRWEGLLVMIWSPDTRNFSGLIATKQVAKHQ